MDDSSDSCGRVSTLVRKRISFSDEEDQPDNQLKMSDRLLLSKGILLEEATFSKKFELSNFEIFLNNSKKVILGIGSTSEVYKVKHKQTGEVFALKEIKKQKLAENEIDEDTIVREIDYHSRFIHPNIVKLLGAAEETDSFFLVLEIVSNTTLFNIIQTEGHLSEETCYIYFMQILAAISFLHQNELVYRDVKPENFLITDKDEVKICDFGNVAPVSENRHSFCGAIEYCAPEMIDDVPYDTRIDVWSLGVLLFEMSQGVSPFAADDYKEICGKIKSLDYELKIEVSKELEDLIKSKGIKRNVSG